MTRLPVSSALSSNKLLHNCSLLKPLLHKSLLLLLSDQSRKIT